MPLLLQVEDLEKVYPLGRGRQVRALSGVTLQILEGQTLGLVGESGCGKSTLGRCILGLEQPTAGRVLFEGKQLSKLSGAAMRQARRNMQYIFQDPHASLDPRLTVDRIVAEPLEVHRMVRGRDARRRRVKELLEQVGLEGEILDRYPHEFSGGQRQRVAIARALASGPRLVVADEPTSSLDVPVRVQILALLRRLQRQTGLSYLFISHDLQVVRQMADQVIVMYLGRVVEQGPAGRVCREPFHPYTRALVAAVPRLGDCEEEQGQGQGQGQGIKGEVPSPIDPPSGCPFHPRCALYGETGNPRCTEIMPALSPVEGEDHRVACYEVERT